MVNGTSSLIENRLKTRFYLFFYKLPWRPKTIGKLWQQIVIIECWCVDVFKYFLIKLGIEHPSILYGQLDYTIIHHLFIQSIVQIQSNGTQEWEILYIIKICKNLCSVKTVLKRQINIIYIYPMKNKFNRMLSEFR